jgi:hypothetical protein
MYLPEREIERVAVSLIAEFGEDAEKQADEFGRSARVRGAGTTAFIWEQVRQRIAELNGGDSHQVREAA